MPVHQPVALAKLTLAKIAPATDGVSRSPVSSYVVAQKPLQGMKIVVDPGHGGQARWDKVLYCGGTVGVATCQTESDVNLRVSLILREYLRAAGAEVIMTRIDDERVTGSRGDKSDELDTRRIIGNKADLFISVHHNEAVQPSTNYTAVFYPRGTSTSVPLADNIASSLGRYMGLQNIGAKSGQYRVLNGLTVPGVIVEASFMSNPDEDRRLLSLAYNKVEAKAIATGILNYVRMSKGGQVDFNTIFAPIDDHSSNAQMIADASFVRRQIIEKKSLFGVRYEEITYDAQGRVTDTRVIGSDSPIRKKSVAVASKVTRAAGKAVSKVSSIRVSSKSSKASVKSSKASVSKSSSKSATKASSSKATAKKPTTTKSTSTKSKSKK